MVAEVLEHLRPTPGATIVDCTLGGGGHARAILDAIAPAGRLIGLDVDPIELPRTEAMLRDAGYGHEVFITSRTNFRYLSQALSSLGVTQVDGLLVDLGVSSMQHDTPSRGFSFRLPGPLDLRLDPTQGAPASERLAALTFDEVVTILTTYSDEPYAEAIADILVSTRPTTTHALERHVRTGLSKRVVNISRSVTKMSVRRTFQALRILVNDELSAIESLLAQVPDVLRPGGRAVFLAFHPGEDARVSHALVHGHRTGVYADVCVTAVRSRKSETWSNRRAASAKLRWAVKAS